MALQNSNYARDAVYIHDKLIESLYGLTGHYFTLNTTGRNAISIDKETGKYTPKTIVVNYVIDGDTVADFKDNLDYLEHILNRKDADISFNDEYDLFMIGDIHNLGLKEKHATWGLGSYEIVCENPLKYSKTVGEVTATKTNDGEQTFNINYLGTAPTEPVIEITPGAANSGSNYDQDAYLEFINVLNQKNNKNVSVGSSYPDGYATKVSCPDFDNVSISTLSADGWTISTGAGLFVGTFSDAYYKKGTGLSYKALYPSSYASGEYDADDPKDTNNILSKTLGSNLTNWLCNYGVRMWAPTIISGGSLKLTAVTSDSKETGVVIYKNSLDNLKGTVLYYVDDKIMGSDTIDLQQYSSSLGLTNRQSGIISRSGKSFFQDDVINKKRPQSAIVEQKLTGSFVYEASNNNISFSRLGQTYTFKVADLPIRRFTYARESGTDEYNKFNIGFKPNMISNTYGNLTMHVCGIDIMSLTKDAILNNWRILSPGNTYKLNTANLDLDRNIHNTDRGLYVPELAGIHNVEHSLLIEPEANTNFQCIYYNKTSGNDPQVKARYNTIYL